MSLFKESVLSVDKISNSDVGSIFSLVNKFKTDSLVPKAWSTHNKFVATLFFEPSTRTRMSFHIACARMGIAFSDLGSEGVSSLSKGETPEDTLYNVAAMKPDIIVMRYGSDPSIERAVGKLSCPVISGGGGVAEHPTQALLDIYTIQENLGTVESKNILYVGDVLHSRVAHSGIKLLKRLGAKVGVACPERLFRADPLCQDLEHFNQLETAVKWADVVIGLRIQKERQSDPAVENFSGFYLDVQAMTHLKKDGLIMHPGPFVPGEDMDRALLSDPRCKIHQQVENGVYVRMALMAKILGLVAT